jgi:hypothetical protein
MAIVHLPRLEMKSRGAEYDSVTEVELSLFEINERPANRKILLLRLGKEPASRHVRPEETGPFDIPACLLVEA